MFLKDKITNGRNSETRTYRVDGNEYSVQLTDIYYYPKLSDETHAFSAELKITVGSKTISVPCRNSGCGGSTDIECYGSNADICRSLNAWLKTQPDTKMMDIMRKQYKIDKVFYRSLEDEVNLMVDDWLEKLDSNLMVADWLKKLNSNN